MQPRIVDVAAEGAQRQTVRRQQRGRRHRLDEQVIVCCRAAEPPPPGESVEREEREQRPERETREVVQREQERPECALMCQRAERCRVGEQPRHERERLRQILERVGHDDGSAILAGQCGEVAVERWIVGADDVPGIVVAAREEAVYQQRHVGVAWWRLVLHAVLHDLAQQVDALHVGEAGAARHRLICADVEAEEAIQREDGDERVRQQPAQRTTPPGDEEQIGKERDGQVDPLRARHEERERERGDDPERPDARAPQEERDDERQADDLAERQPLGQRRIDIGEQVHVGAGQHGGDARTPARHACQAEQHVELAGGQHEEQALRHADGGEVVTSGEREDAHHEEWVAGQPQRIHQLAPLHDRMSHRDIAARVRVRVAQNARLVGVVGERHQRGEQHGGRAPGQPPAAVPIARQHLAPASPPARAHHAIPSTLRRASLPGGIDS